MVAGGLGSDCSWGRRFLFFFPKYFFFNILLFSLLFSFFGCAKQHVGSWFPDQGLNLCPPHWKNGVPTTGKASKVPGTGFLSGVMKTF